MLFFLGGVNFASWGKSCAGAILPLVKHNWWKWSCDDTQRDKGLGFTVSLQLMKRRQGAANSLPAQKLWQYSSIWLSHYRCHSQLSRSCIPNLSCHHFG